MNIVHLQLSGGIGGISILTRDIAKASDNNNIFYFLFEGGVIADDMAKNGSEVYVENGRHFAFLSEAIKFTKFCKKHKADVIIAHTGSPICRFLGFFAKKHMKHVKFLLYFHSNALSSSYHNKMKDFLDASIEKAAFRACDSGVAISNSVKAGAAEKYGFNPDKIKVVYNGINCEKFYSERLDTKDDKLNIIYVGRVFREKGTHILIDAISACKCKNKIDVKIVGHDHGGFTEKMKNKADRLGLNDIITFTGPQTDIPKYLAQSDVFIHPAICLEGFGITLAEAMAAYLPCIAFNRGAIPEIIDNGENGFIVDQIDANKLAAAIDEVYALYGTQKYTEMRMHARKKAQTFSIETVVKELEALYN